MVFDGVSFSISDGQALWVRGKNGAGKSSLLRICAQLLKPVGGVLSWQETDVSRHPDIYQGKYHYLGHQDALKAVLTVSENLDFWAGFQGAPDVEKALGDYDLAGLKNIPVALLSAGQKKRAALARLAASPAPLWILDEPVSSLDTHFMDLFKQRLTEHLEQGGMALFATHQDLELSNISILDLDVGRAV